MRIFESKNMGLFKKLIIFLLILIIISFFLSGNVQAKDDAKGGKLLNPIADLLVFTGDGIMNITHTVMYSQNDTTISVDLTTSILGTLATIAVGFVVAALAVVATVLTAGAVVAAAAAIGVTLSAIGAGTVLLVGVGAGITAAVVFNSNVLPDVIEIPVYQISPDKIFSNEILMFDVDFFNPKEKKIATNVKGEKIKNSDGSYKYIESTAEQLRSTISNWYVILRDIAVVALLSILVYVGIRILISSTSNDKAKYKQMLMDWVVALCLLFFMQYIMSFSNLIVGKITDIVKTTKSSEGYVALIADEDGKVADKLVDLGYYDSTTINDIKTKIEGVDYIQWPTNILGYARLEAQMAKKESASYAGYALIFVVLVLFTIYFVVTYLKRVLYMAFLTLIAPLVAMTYPIDKMNDGKAQAFNMWFKEYIFNLLIQPMHLLLFTVLVSSAYELAKTNIIYSLVALGFMIPAEKLLRKFFGFEKAQTPGLLAGPAGAAVMMNGMNKLLGKGPKGHGKPSSGNGGSSSETVDSGKPPRINPNFDKEAALFGEPNGETNNMKQLPEKESNKNNTDSFNENYGLEEGQDAFNSTYANGKLGKNNDYVSIDNASISINSAIQGDNNNGNINKDDSGIGMQRSLNDDSNPNTNAIRMNYNDNQKGISSKVKRKLKGIKTGAQNMGTAVRKGTIPLARYYGRGMASQVKNGMKNVHPIRTAARFAAGAAGATALGAAGLAVGITSGDLSKAAQYTGAAAMGGYKMATGMKDGIDSLTPDGINDVVKRSAFENDAEYEKVQQQKYVKEYQKNEKNRFELERKYGKKQADEIMKNVVPNFLDNGVTDMKDITTILEMKDNEQIKDINEGIAVKKYASRIGTDTTKMKQKDRDEWHKTFATEFGKKDKYKDYNHDNMANSVLNKVDSFNKIRYSK